MKKKENFKNVLKANKYTSIFNDKGITLVALIITIIILLILAGISIAALTESGLFEKSRQAKQKSENAQIEEELTLGDYENKIDGYINNTREVVTIDKSEYEQLKSDVQLLKNTVEGLGSVQTVSNTKNSVAKGNITLCSLTLNPGKYVILSEVQQADTKTNSLSIWLTGCNYTTHTSTESSAQYNTSHKMQNLSGFVDVQEGTKTISLMVYSESAYSLSGSILAIKLK